MPASIASRNRSRAATIFAPFGVSLDPGFIGLSSLSDKCSASPELALPESNKPIRNIRLVADQGVINCQGCASIPGNLKR